MLIFPTSYYFTIGYTESLFLLITTSALYAYRSKNYIVAGILAMLASATRVQGVTLLAFFLIDIFFSYRKDRTLDKMKLVSVVLSVVGIGAYAFYLWREFGDPIAFITVQKNWGRLNANFIENLINSFKPLYIWYIATIVIGLIGIKQHLDVRWFWFSVIFILLPISSGRLDSLNRYVVTLPLLFVGLSLFLSKKPSFYRDIYITSSALLLGYNIVYFVNDYWVA